MEILSCGLDWNVHHVDLSFYNNHDIIHLVIFLSFFSIKLVLIRTFSDIFQQLHDYVA